MADTPLSAQQHLDIAIDAVLDALELAAKENVEVDPLQTIVARLQARGDELDVSQMPPLVQMVLGGALG